MDYLPNNPAVRRASTEGGRGSGESPAGRVYASQQQHQQPPSIAAGQGGSGGWRRSTLADPQCALNLNSHSPLGHLEHLISPFACRKTTNALTSTDHSSPFRAARSYVPTLSPLLLPPSRPFKSSQTHTPPPPTMDINLTPQNLLPQDAQVFADSINSPVDSGIASCPSNTSIYTPSAIGVHKIPNLASLKGVNNFGSTCTDLTSNASGSPTPSPEESEMPKPVVLPSETSDAHSLGSQSTSAFRPYLPKSVYRVKESDNMTQSTRSSTDSDPRTSVASNQSSGRNSLRDSLRNSMASSESSNYSIVSEHSSANDNITQQMQTGLDAKQLLAATLTPTVRPVIFNSSLQFPNHVTIWLESWLKSW